MTEYQQIIELIIELWQIAAGNRWIVLAVKFILAIVIANVMPLILLLLASSITREFARWVWGWLGVSLMFGGPFVAVFLGGWWWLLPPASLVILALYSQVNYRDGTWGPTTWVEVLGSFKWKRTGHQKLSSPELAAAADFLILDGPLRPGVDALAEGNSAEAREEFEALAQAGNAAAMNNLGVLHEAGLGVPVSKADALKWYRKASDSGVPLAKHNLAVLIAADHIIGTAEPDADRERDFIEAHALFASAASQGVTTAKRALRDLRRHMTREQIAAAKKAAG